MSYFPLILQSWVLLNAFHAIFSVHLTSLTIDEVFEIVVLPSLIKGI